MFCGCVGKNKGVIEMKKIISLISVLALLLSMMTTVAFADENNKLEWEEVGKTESTITLKLVFTTNKNITSAGCYFSLDDAIANGVTAVSGKNISAKVFQANYAKSVIAATIADTNGETTGRVELCEVTFTFGDTTKSFTLPLKSGKKFEVKDADRTVVTDDFSNTAFTQEITVGSKDVPVESITLNKEVMELDLNGTTTETLIATVLPADATDPTVTWESDKPEIATVDGGKVTAVAEGEAKITATAGGKTATCKVTVKDTTPPEKPIVDVTPSKITGDYGTKTLKYIAKIVKNADATSYIKVTKTLGENTESKTTTQTIAQLLGGEANDGALITADVAIGVLTADTDAVFSFGLVK